MSKFHFNDFLGLSAPMLLLLDSSKRAEILSCARSAIMKTKLCSLRVEFELLKTTLSNLSVSTEWATVYQDLEPVYNFSNNGSIVDKEARKTMRAVFGAYKKYLASKGLQRDELLDMFLSTTESEELLKKFYSDVLAKSVLQNEFTDLNGDVIVLSDNAFKLLSVLYENKDVIDNIFDEIDTKLGICGNGSPGNVKIFGEKLLDLISLNRIITINRDINTVYSEVLKLNINSVTGYTNALKDYEKHCNNLFDIVKDKESDSNKVVPVSKKYIDLESVIADVHALVLSEGVISYEQLTTTYKDIVLEIARCNAFEAIISVDPNYILDLFKYLKNVQLFTSKFYSNFLDLSEELNGQELLDVFLEIASIGVIGLTVNIKDYFSELVSSSKINDSVNKFNLDKQSNAVLITNTKMLLKDIESKQYFV